MLQKRQIRNSVKPLHYFETCNFLKSFPSVLPATRTTITLIEREVMRYSNDVSICGISLLKDLENKVWNVVFRAESMVTIPRHVIP